MGIPLDKGGKAEAATLVTFFVPGPPTAKARPRVTTIHGRPRLYTPAATARYEQRVALAGYAAMAGRPLLAGALSVAIEVRLTVPASWSGKRQHRAIAGEIRPTSRPDASNYVKSVEDGLNGVVWRDDAQVVDLRVTKRYHEAPGVLVSVTPMYIET